MFRVGIARHLDQKVCLDGCETVQAKYSTIGNFCQFRCLRPRGRESQNISASDTIPKTSIDSLSVNRYPDHFGLPRGCLEELQSFLQELNIDVRIHDKRFNGTNLDLEFQGDLRSEQLIAAKRIQAYDNGVLSATTAFGKTVVAAWLIAERNVNTLVLVHRRQLMDQWIERLAEFLGISERDIGRFGGGTKKLTGRVDVAVIQSLVRKGVVKDCVADYGHVVVDECHHLSARSFELVARRVKAKYTTGLSATVTRKDGHHPIVFMQCGPVRHRVDAKAQAIQRPFRHTVYVRSTSFRPLEEMDEDDRTLIHRLYEKLIVAETRNTTICQDIIHCVNKGHWPLVLTERREHLAVENPLSRSSTRCGAFMCSNRTVALPVGVLPSRCFGQQAVFAAIHCPLTNPFARGSVHELTCLSREHLLRLGLQNGEHIQSLGEVLVFILTKRIRKDMGNGQFTCRGDYCWLPGLCESIRRVDHVVEDVLRQV